MSGLRPPAAAPAGGTPLMYRCSGAATSGTGSGLIVLPRPRWLPETNTGCCACWCCEFGTCCGVAVASGRPDRLTRASAVASAEGIAWGPPCIVQLQEIQMRKVHLSETTRTDITLQKLAMHSGCTCML